MQRLMSQVEEPVLEVLLCYNLFFIYIAIKQFNILLNNILYILLTIQIVCYDVLEFIKKGANAATIEITLTNKGDFAYKPDIYGDIIIITRIIGTTYTYRIKNWKSL